MRCGRCTQVFNAADGLLEIETGGQKTAYKVAVVKVESALLGAANTTHIKIGLAMPAGGRGRGPIVGLDENQEGLFFLTKDPSGKFHTFNGMSSPVSATDESYKAAVANVKRALAVIADPIESLRAEKAEDRAFAAIALALKHRSVPQSGGEIGLEKIPAEESKRILKGLAEANWTKSDPSLPPPSSVFYLLGITTVDGWEQPKPAAAGTDFNEVLHAAFVKWIEGAGKDYRINKYVVKK